MARKDILDVLVLRAYQEAARLRVLDMSRLYWPEDILAEWTGQPEKVCWAAMERAVERDYIEYGVSVRGGWVTPKGEALLRESID